MEWEKEDRVKDFMEEIQKLVEEYRLDFVVGMEKNRESICFGVKDIDTGEILYKIRGVK